MKSKKAAPKRKVSMTKATPALAVDESFAEIVGMIAEARQRAVQAVNTALIDLIGRWVKRSAAKLRSMAGVRAR